MTPIDIRNALDQLGWSLTDAAPRLGISYRSLHAAATDDVAFRRNLRRSTELLLQAAIAWPGVRLWLEQTTRHGALNDRQMPMGEFHE